VETVIQIPLRLPGKQLLQQVESIAHDPAGQTPEVKEQLAALAKAVGAVADYCADLHKVLDTLTKNVEFKGRG
jgi:hypothetical protein